MTRGEARLSALVQVLETRIEAMRAHDDQVREYHRSLSELVRTMDDIGPLVDRVESALSRVDRTDWMTTREAASYLRVEPWTIRKWCDDGILTAHRSWDGAHLRFDRRELDGVMRQGGAA